MFSACGRQPLLQTEGAVMVGRQWFWHESPSRAVAAQVLDYMSFGDSSVGSCLVRQLRITAFFYVACFSILWVPLSRAAQHT
jgi:hypothetical protein